MEFTVKKSDFLKELSLIQGVVEKKNTIPILSYVLISATDGQLTMVATDMDLSLKSVCPAEIKASGTVAIQAKRLFEIVRNLPEAEIQITKLEGDNIQIQCERFSSKVLGQAPENFPNLPIADQTGHTTKAETLKQLIAKTIFAITQEESRFALGGALLLQQDGKLGMVATDGHRLAIIQTEQSEAESSAGFRTLIPKKALGELLKLVQEADSEVVFFQDENHLFFKVGPRLLITRILSGQFPNFELVIPKDNNRKLRVNTQWLAQALRRVALMADERSRAIKFSVNESKLEITSSNSEAGEASEFVPIEYDGPTINIAFNAQYLSDFLNVCSEETLSIELKDEQSQAQVRPVADNGLDYKYIIMPMRL